MIAKQLRVGHGTERRPPELSLEPFLVDAVHQGLHVGVSVWKFLGIELPITDIILPTIVERDPLKSHSLRRRKRVIHLLRLNLSAISPRTPDGAERVIGSRGHLETLFHHEAPVVDERAEVVPLMNGDEGAKGM